MGVEEVTRLEIDGKGFELGLRKAGAQFDGFSRKISQIQSGLGTIGTVVRGLGLLELGSAVSQIGGLIANQIEQSRLRALRAGIRDAGGLRAGSASRRAFEEAQRIRGAAPGAFGTIFTRFFAAAKEALGGAGFATKTFAERIREAADASSESRDAALAHATELEKQAKRIAAGERLARGVTVPQAVSQLQAAGVPADLIQAFQKQVENQANLVVIQRAAAETLKRAAEQFERALFNPSLLGGSAGQTFR